MSSSSSWMGRDFSDDEAAAAEDRFVPSWLRPLLTAKFFEPCAFHPELVRNERNHYCLDCAGDNGAICCSLCISAHRSHRVVQIRRSSYHEVIRVAELKALADVSLVQTYIINADKVMFLNPRPRAPQHFSKCVGAAGACEECGRGLVDAVFRFCSLGCKLKSMASDANLTFILDPKHKWEGSEEGDLSGPSNLQTTRQISYRRHARKGVHRAPTQAPFF
ncbi:protein RGF1 INDUCIBLE TRANSCRIPTION FACTOR 1-like [Lolium perenne]|uniref:protein RGF1 INDUCIBLE TRANSCRIPTION FACTOR 1-like n=1 Tax=Lolium perenne TaxID=4522 RepID=UPI0021F51323|nr:protein RGF1 INDUCIBLE TRANSCRIPTION FACTOR 1-like [Lolium perenne]